MKERMQSGVRSEETRGSFGAIKQDNGGTIHIYRFPKPFFRAAGEHTRRVNRRLDSIIYHYDLPSDLAMRQYFKVSKT